MASSAPCGSQQLPSSPRALCCDTAHGHRELFDAITVRIYSAPCSDIPHREQRVERHRLQLPGGWRRERVRRPWMGHRRCFRVRLQQESNRHSVHRDIHKGTASTEADPCRQTADRRGGDKAKNFGRLQTSGPSSGVGHRESRSSVF